MDMDDFIEYLFVTDQLDEEKPNNEYWDKVNNFWQDIRTNALISGEIKNKIYDLCNKLVEEKSESNKQRIIKEIEDLIK